MSRDDDGSALLCRRRDPLERDRIDADLAGIRREDGAGAVEGRHAVISDRRQTRRLLGRCTLRRPRAKALPLTLSERLA